MASAFATAAFGCSVDGVVEQPSLGKGDALGQVKERGTLFFGEAEVREIQSDFQFDGFRVEIGKDSIVSFETTHLGSSQGFDTTLFVYGPRAPFAGFGDNFRLMDDNSGFGPLSKLQDVELEAGEYLVVVGTPDALGRGRYRLLASCESGDCGSQAAALTAAEHSDILDELNFDCVFQSCDGDFSWSASDFTCDFVTQKCRASFLSGAHAFSGGFDEAAAAAAVGSSKADATSDGRAFVASIDGIDGDEDGTLLVLGCDLDGYDSAARILDLDNDLRSSFQGHLLECIFTLEDMMFDLVE